MAIWLVGVQLSLAVAASQLAGASQVARPGPVATLTFCGQVMLGGALVLTVAAKVQVLPLPAASVALAVIVVVPTGKTSPLWTSSSFALPDALPILMAIWLVGVQLSLAVAASQLAGASQVARPGPVATLTFCGQVMLGGALVLTVAAKVQVLPLPAASVALAVIVVVPTGKTSPLWTSSSFALPDALPILMAIWLLGVQLSLAVAASQLAGASQVARFGPVATLTFGGQVMLGGVVSLTVTVKVQVLLLPAASVAFAVIVVVPTGKTSPLWTSAWFPCTSLFRSLMAIWLVGVQLSLAVAASQLAGASQVARPGPVATLTFCGQVMLGGVVSLTVTVKVQVLLLPAASVAFAVIVVVPTGKTSPLWTSAWLGWP